MSSSEQPTDMGISAPPGGTPAPPPPQPAPVELSATVIIAPASPEPANLPMTDAENSQPEPTAPEASSLHQSTSEKPDTAILQFASDAPNIGTTVTPVIVEPAESMEITNPLDAAQVAASELAAVASDVLPSVLPIANPGDPSVVVQDLDIVTTEIVATKPSDKLTSPDPPAESDAVDPNAAQSQNPSDHQTTTQSGDAPSAMLSEPAQDPKTDPVESVPSEREGLETQDQGLRSEAAVNLDSAEPTIGVSSVDVMMSSTTASAPEDDSKMKDIEQSKDDEQSEKVTEKEAPANPENDPVSEPSVKPEGKEKAVEDDEAAMENEWSFSFSNEESRSRPLPTQNLSEAKEQSEVVQREEKFAVESVEVQPAVESIDAEALAATPPSKDLEFADKSVVHGKDQIRSETLPPSNAEPAKNDLNINADSASGQGTNEIESNESDKTKNNPPAIEEATIVTEIVIDATTVEKDLTPTAPENANDGDVDMADAERSALPVDDNKKGTDVLVTKGVSEKASADDNEIAAVDDDEIRVSTPVAKKATKGTAVTGAKSGGESGSNVHADSAERPGSARTSARRASRTSAAARMTRSGRSLGNGSVRPSASGKDAADTGGKTGVSKTGGAPGRSTRASMAGASGAPNTLPQAEIGSAAKVRGASVKASRAVGAGPSEKDVSVEARLKRELEAASALIMAQAEQIEELTRSLQEERINVSDMTDSHRAELNYSQQLSRLVRVFRELNVALPPLTGSDWNARSVAQAVRNSIKTELADSGEWTPAAEQRAFELLRILLGAKVIQPGEDGANTIKLAMRNEDLQREISFWLFWNDTNVRYTRIHMDVPEIAAPEFASEVSIDFDVRQGPHFLFQLLSSLFHQS